MTLLMLLLLLSMLPCLTMVEFYRSGSEPKMNLRSIIQQVRRLVPDVLYLRCCRFARVCYFACLKIRLELPPGVRKTCGDILARVRGVVGQEHGGRHPHFVPVGVHDPHRLQIYSKFQCIKIILLYFLHSTVSRTKCKTCKNSSKVLPSVTEFEPPPPSPPFFLHDCTAACIQR